LPEHAWNVGLHENAHCPAVQTTSAFATEGHLALHPPQWFVLMSVDTHSLPQSAGAEAGHPVVHWKDAPNGAQTGTLGGHAVLQAPQLTERERSLSQPSLGSRLQSAQPRSHAPTEQRLAWQTAVP
jgi:hypothetical protein